MFCFDERALLEMSGNANTYSWGCLRGEGDCRRRGKGLSSSNIA
jgi:hypothetical protein